MKLREEPDLHNSAAAEHLLTLQRAVTYEFVTTC